MRILIVSNLYGPLSRGGAETIARQVAEELVRQQHHVVVLSTTGRRDAEFAVSNEAGVEVLRFDPELPYHLLDDAQQPIWRRLLWHAWDLLPWSRSTGWMQRAIDHAKPDLILTHNLRGMGMGLVTAIRRSGVRWVHVLHDVQLLVPSGLRWLDRAPAWQRPWITLPYQLWTRFLMGSPETVIGPSQYVLDAHRAAGLFPRSHMRQQTNPVAAPEQVSRQLDPDVMHLLFVGQLTQSKGLHVLLEVLREVDWPVWLDVVGDGPEQTALQERSLTVPEHVHCVFHGRLKREQVFTYLAQAHALVVPSVVVENCPGVILEAASVGTPVIGSDQGGIPELVHESGLFAPGSSASLVDALRRLKDGAVKASPSQPTNLEQYTKHLLQ